MYTAKYKSKIYHKTILAEAMQQDSWREEGVRCLDNWCLQLLSDFLFSTAISYYWFRPPFLELACAPIVETKFLELAMSLLNFSPWIPLDTFSILLLIFYIEYFRS